MIVCVKCGMHNGDESLYCQDCGYKLQTGRSALGDDQGWEELEERIQGRFWTGEIGRAVLKCLEAWALALALVGLAFWCVYAQVFWPLYLAAPLALVLARLRKL